MPVKVDNTVYPRANFFRVDPGGNLEMYGDAGGLDVSKVAVVASGNWTYAEVLEGEGA